MIQRIVKVPESPTLAAAGFTGDSVTAPGLSDQGHGRRKRDGTRHRPIVAVRAQKLVSRQHLVQARQDTDGAFARGQGAIL